jgi:outer membrane protein OmpA-like peptidoglycan-associated protein
LTCLIVTVLFISNALSAFYMKREAYIDIPTANFDQGLYIDVNSSYPIRSQDSIKFDPNLAIDFSYNKFGAALKWYNGMDFALDLSCQLLVESGNYPALAVGVGEIAISKHVSPAGSDKVFSDENYTDRSPEVASAYIVGTKKIGKNFEMTAGIGRGRFIGYGPRSHIVNTDLFFDDNHENIAMGLFTGIRLILPNNMAFILEEDGRDANIGIEYENKLLKGTLALNKLELFGTNSEYGLSPRISLNLSYKIGDFREDLKEVKNSKQKNMTSLTIRLTDKDLGNLVKGKVVIVDQKGDTIVISGNNKTHIISLPPGIYMANAAALGYVDAGVKVTVEEGVEDNTVYIEMNQKDILEVLKETKNLEDLIGQIESIIVYFPFKNFELTPRASGILGRLIELLKDGNEINLKIIGHTCSIGTPEGNQILSKRRADNVKKYLVERGIPPERLITEGYGQRKPIASNDTEEGRVLNRRVEFIPYKKGQ